MKNKDVIVCTEFNVNLGGDTSNIDFYFFKLEVQFVFQSVSFVNSKCTHSAWRSTLLLSKVIRKVAN